MLNQALITILGRKKLFMEKAQQFRNFTLNYQSPQQNPTYDMVKGQLMLLDLLGNIFMSLEDYLVYSHHLRNPLRDFHKKIAARNTQVPENEINYLKGIVKKDINSYLLLPKSSDFQFQQEENDLVRSYLNNIVTDMYNKIRNILKFYNRYYRIYIRYKYVLPSILGLYSRTYDIKSNTNIISSFIYIRDNLDKKGKNKFNTYIIQATGLDVLTYFEDIADDIDTIFQFLVLS